ncbi:hypothetical protein ABIE26_002718 [Pedobacter africanus]|uniref:Uncharacterized protein n=1 Tax=Pedobacter africanus TaxID=151894 RepID=A0ACC6KXP2_9SPHI|nr:DUF6266 family protein [Pedobacter africanus]MDR6783893.1 hypothetical protein [Pedobacter africanus]
MFSKANDKATFIIYNPQKEKFVTFKDAAQRLNKETVMQLPKTFTDDTVHAWMQYTNAEDDMVSTSVYLGEIAVG